jgi:hypothetical protein
MRSGGQSDDCETINIRDHVFVQERFITLYHSGKRIFLVEPNKEFEGCHTWRHRNSRYVDCATQVSTNNKQAADARLFQTSFPTKKPRGVISSSIFTQACFSCQVKPRTLTKHLHSTCGCARMGGATRPNDGKFTQPLQESLKI